MNENAKIGGGEDAIRQRVDCEGDLIARPHCQIESLPWHEAFPRDYLQLAIPADLTDLYPIRHKSNFTVLIDDWGLNPEGLGNEIGFYKDPYRDFGRLSMDAVSIPAPMLKRRVDKWIESELAADWYFVAACQDNC